MDSPYKRTVSRAARKGLDLLTRHACGARYGRQDRPPDTFRPDFSICTRTEGQARGRTYSPIGAATRRRSMEAYDARTAQHRRLQGSESVIQHGGPRFFIRRVTRSTPDLRLLTVSAAAMGT